VLIKGIVEREKNDVGEPPLMVFVRVGGEDPLDIRDALVAQVGEDGGAAIQEVGSVVHRHHVATAFSHQGERARVSNHLENDV
jgi:hypothetical protein